MGFHGGAYFSGCGHSRADAGPGGAHSFDLPLEPRPGSRRPALDESHCSVDLHGQCDFNDSCMLEVRVRTRDERVSVLPDGEVGDRLRARLGRMWEDGRRGADVVVRCGAASFPYYSLLLAAHSDVFEAMLDRPGFAEHSSGAVDVADASPGATAAFLQVLATGRLGRSDFRRHALELFRLADKYNVAPLAAAAEREAAEAAAAASPSPARLLATLAAARLHGSGAMWRAAAASAAAGRSAVLASEEWAAVEREQPELAKQIHSEVL